jgi:hypothetical protein
VWERYHAYFSSDIRMTPEPGGSGKVWQHTSRGSGGAAYDVAEVSLAIVRATKRNADLDRALVCVLPSGSG